MVQVGLDFNLSFQVFDQIQRLQLAQIHHFQGTHKVGWLVKYTIYFSQLTFAQSLANLKVLQREYW